MVILLTEQPEGNSDSMTAAIVSSDRMLSPQNHKTCHTHTVIVASKAAVQHTALLSLNSKQPLYVFTLVHLWLSDFWGNHSPLAVPQEAALDDFLTLSKAFSVSAACTFFRSCTILSVSAFSWLTAALWSRAALCLSCSLWRLSSISCCFCWAFTWTSSSLSLWIWFSRSQITWNREQFFQRSVTPQDHNKMFEWVPFT